MHVIGTAGHVDHGKSTLVKALTGIDPDRLREEKKRQMTIDLGFAWYESPSLGPIGIVDVPGHRDFISNMLAGVGGIEAVLLVIAADEGIMPQTREHLSIINLLQIPRGVVALTKVDMVSDPDWIDLVESDIQKTLATIVLAKSPIIRVSSLTGEGLDRLRQEIDLMLTQSGVQPDRKKPRLPVDRVFSIQGYGTVVTGTLIGGCLDTDEEIIVLPSEKSGRIRGLQTHKKNETRATPGSRTAINLVGIDVNEISRGDVVTRPGVLQSTTLIDASIEILADSPVGIKHNQTVKIYAHTAECAGRVRVMQTTGLAAGETGYVQIEFENKMVLDKGDRFILRRMSPALTIGGGLVLDAHPAKFYKLHDPYALERFRAISSDSVQDRLYSRIFDSPFVTRKDLADALDKESGDALTQDLQSLVDQRKIVILGDIETDETMLLTTVEWERLTRQVTELIRAFHERYPLLPGMKLDELRARLKIQPGVFTNCLGEWKRSDFVKENNGILSLKSFRVKLSANQEKRYTSYFEQVKENPYNPPSVKIAREILGPDLYQSLLEQNVMVQLNAEVVFRGDEYEEMLKFVVSECARGNLLTLAEFRDHFSTSRKYSQAFLEYLDRKGMTVREGEGRRLKSPAQ